MYVQYIKVAYTVVLFNSEISFEERDFFLLDDWRTFQTVIAANFQEQI